MNYQRIYSNLIELRKANVPDGYSEKHHITPRSMGGSNSPDNLVKLTGREHFVAHRLLAKIHGGRMWLAVTYMSQPSTTSSIGYLCTSRVYEYAKQKDAEWRSERYSGAGNHWFGKKFSHEYCEKLRGPRPSVTGENNPRYGVDMGADFYWMVEMIKSYVPTPFDIDTTVMDRINASVGIIRAKSGDIKTDELRKLGEYFRGVALSAMVLPRFGSDNPNYGNGQAISGEKNPMWGKKHSDSTKSKISAKARRRITCPHCGKTGNIANIHRWHLDNCKAKP